MDNNVKTNEEKSQVEEKTVPAAPAAPAPIDDNKDKGLWFVVHTYSGHESKAAAALKQRVAAMNLTAKIFEILVPTRNIVVVRHGKKEETKEKIFPGYIIF